MNRLAAQTSPYLRQHANNPVDWYPWGPEALEHARLTGKPVHLSIGYAACHWCHVLAHESFEDAATAELLNAHFVNIKVDREERPDLDRIYQIALQLLTQQRGGWPLTMFLTPDDQQPFFGGTYFPKEAGFGLPPFRTVLERVHRYYTEHHPELRAQNAALRRAFIEIDAAPEGAPLLDDAPLQAGRDADAADFDCEHGGFGAAPKFPQAARLERLLRDGDASARSMLALTLTRMAEGGIYDQLAGGFSRYSVDAEWMIPHFEKMLYDNGSLLAVYADAAQVTGDALFRTVASETADWLLRELQSPEGGFYSSFDADSEGEEGKFYVWDQGAATLLTPEEWASFAPRFGFDREPNFEGRWLPFVARPIAELAELNSIAPALVTQRIDAARSKLLAARARRIPPARDEKILTSWNALAIRGLARAARALDRVDLGDAATRALDELRRTAWRDGRLLATSKDGHAQCNAYLDDYVFLADAVLELLEVRWRTEDLDLLRALLDVVLAHFEDERGGFFFTSDDHESLIHRLKSFADEATPSGNGVAALVLQRAGHLLGETRYLEAAERTLRAGWLSMQASPAAHATLRTALEEWLDPPALIILRGPRDELEHWLRVARRAHAPRRQLFAIPADAGRLPDALASKPALDTVTAYICQGSVCTAITSSLDDLLAREKG
jgi:uncharacterized protein YyaL (SSP411 family)